MDLHLTAHHPSTDEKAVVDRELGADPGSNGRSAFGGHDTQRHKLLPVLHALQARVGFLSPGALNHVSERLNVAPAEVHGVASFYGMFSLSPRPKVVAGQTVFNIYGNGPRFGEPRLHLHSREIGIPIARSKDPVRVVAPAPEHMHERLRACGWQGE